MNCLLQDSGSPFYDLSLLPLNFGTDPQSLPVDPFLAILNPDHCQTYILHIPLWTGQMLNIVCAHTLIN